MYGQLPAVVWRGHDGTLCFADREGLVSVRPGEVPVNRLPPPVVIEEIFVGRKIA